MLSNENVKHIEAMTGLTSSQLKSFSPEKFRNFIITHKSKNPKTQIKKYNFQLFNQLL